MRCGTCWATSILLCVALLGCGTSPPSVSGSLEEATVRGVVRVHGKAVNNGTVTFNSTNINRPNVAPVQAKIGADGKYEVKTHIGQNYIEVDCKELRQSKNRALADTQISVDVKAGESTIDVDLPTNPADAATK